MLTVSVHNIVGPSEIGQDGLVWPYDLGNLKIRAALNARIVISGSTGAHEGAPAERVSPHILKA